MGEIEKVKKDLILEKHVNFISTYGKTHEVYVSCSINLIQF